MKIKQHTIYLLLLFLLTLFPLSGCSSGFSPGKQTDTETKTEAKTTSRETYTDVCTPKASQTTVYGDDTTSLDASHTENGYLMLRYDGEVSKVKLQITIPDSTVYTYTLNPDSYGTYETFPLSGSNGTYQADLYENVTDDKYALIFSQSLDVTLKDEFQPYLYPNQYVWFTNDSKVTKKGQALLRSQHIPTKLEVGYSGEAYHAWISVYLDEVGWVDNIIEFDGKDWSLMDPTLAASNSADSVKKYIGDGSNYTVKYSY